jgi:hypothetical protein
MISAQNNKHLTNTLLAATNTPFQQSLGELIKLDTEAFRVFHQILHIRHISGWSDNKLYQIEQQIIAIVGSSL